MLTTVLHLSDQAAVKSCQRDDAVPYIEIRPGKRRLIGTQSLVQLPVRFHRVADTIGNIFRLSISVSSGKMESVAELPRHTACDAEAVSFGSIGEEISICEPGIGTAGIDGLLSQVNSSIISIPGGIIAQVDLQEFHVFDRFGEDAFQSIGETELIGEIERKAISQHGRHHEIIIDHIYLCLSCIGIIHYPSLLVRKCGDAFIRAALRTQQGICSGLEWTGRNAVGAKIDGAETVACIVVGITDPGQWNTSGEDTGASSQHQCAALIQISPETDTWRYERLREILLRDLRQWCVGISLTEIRIAESIFRSAAQRSFVGDLRPVEPDARCNLEPGRDPDLILRIHAEEVHAETGGWIIVQMIPVVVEEIEITLHPLRLVGRENLRCSGK